MSFLVNINFVYTQTTQDLNFIIEVDNDIVKVINGPQIEIIKKDGSKEFLTLSYIPGNLSIERDALGKLNDLNTESMIFSFLFNKNINSRQYHYRFNFKKDWLNSKYMIVSIKNLNTRKLKKAYEPIRKSSNYNIAIDFGSYKILSLKE